MRISIMVEGEKLVNREILRVGEHAGDARPAFSAIASLIIDETAQQFATEGAHGSGGWKPLAESTLREKRRLGFGSRGILERTLTLERSLTERGDPNMILEVSPDELAFGSRVGYGRYHQTGTTRLPQRQPFALNEEARRRIVKVLQAWIVTGEVIP
jgi:hypothetical protein